MDFRKNFAKIFDTENHQVLVTLTYNNTGTDELEECYDLKMTIVGSDGNELVMTMNIPTSREEYLEEMFSNVNQETAEDVVKQMTSEVMYKMLEGEK